MIEDTTQIARDDTGLGFLSAIGTEGTTYMYICGPVSGKVVVFEPSPAIKVGRGNATAGTLDRPTKHLADRSLTDPRLDD